MTIPSTVKGVCPRLASALADALGPTVLDALSDPDVIEVMANPDQRLWVEHRPQGRILVGAMPQASTEAAIRLIASSAGRTVNPHEPMIAAMLPPVEALGRSRSRFQGMWPPLVAAPSFVIRKLGSVVWGLNDYVGTKIATQQQIEVLREAMTARKNVIVAGGTSSGKTTLLNACLAEPCFQEARVVLLEDTAELNFTGEDAVGLVAEPPNTLRDLVKATLRLRPDRIVVGEVRGGEALEMLKAWNTGHPGGLGTVHSDGPVQAMQRIKDLAAEASTVSNQTVVDAIGLVVFIRRDEHHPAGRVIESVAEPGLNREGRFEVRPVGIST